MLDGVHVGQRFSRWLEVLGITLGQAVERTGRTSIYLHRLQEGSIARIYKADVYDVFSSLSGGAKAKGAAVAEDYTEQEILRLIDQDPKPPDCIDP